MEEMPEEVRKEAKGTPEEGTREQEPLRAEQEPQGWSRGLLLSHWHRLFGEFGDPQNGVPKHPSTFPCQAHIQKGKGSESKLRRSGGPLL